MPGDMHLASQATPCPRLKDLGHLIFQSQRRRELASGESGNRGAHNTFFKSSCSVDPSRSRKEVAVWQVWRPFPRRHLSVALEAGPGVRAASTFQLPVPLEGEGVGPDREAAGNARRASAFASNVRRELLQAKGRPAVPPGRQGTA